MAEPAQTLYTVDHLADRWGVNHKTVRAMIKRGDLKHFCVGRHIRITAAAVREFEGWNSDSPSTEDTTPPNGEKTGGNGESRFEPRIVGSPRAA